MSSAIMSGTVAGLPCDVFFAQEFRNQYKDHNMRLEIAEMVLETVEEQAVEYDTTQPIILGLCIRTQSIIGEFDLYMTYYSGRRGLIMVHADQDDQQQFIRQTIQVSQGAPYDRRNTKSETLQ
jgi:hypothetical protein